MKKYDKASGRWLNQLLKRDIFDDSSISTQQVKQTIGLEIREVVMCWLFEHKNTFRTAVQEFIQKGAPLNYKEIQGH